MHVCIRNEELLQVVAIPGAPYLISGKERDTLKDLGPPGTRIRLFSRRSWPAVEPLPIIARVLKLAFCAKHCQALAVPFSFPSLIFSFSR